MKGGKSMATMKELRTEATEKVKEIVKAMNGLSEENFISEYNHNPNFHNGFNVLVQLFMQAKFNID
jgi:hypothetical protein